MDVPLNLLHNYLGFPILVGVAIDSLIRYRKTRNRTVYFLALACFFAALATASFGIPALLTENNYRISWGTFVGDAFLAVSMLCFWQISVRATFSKPVVIGIVNTILSTLTLALIVEAVFRNLTPPYGSHLIHDGSGRLALEYTDTLFFTIFSALDGLALVFVGIYFLRQGGNAPTRGQRIRIRSAASGFSLGALAFLLTPVFPVDLQPAVNLLFFSSGFIVMMVGGLIGIHMTRAEKTAS